MLSFCSSLWDSRVFNLKYGHRRARECRQQSWGQVRSGPGESGGQFVGRAGGERGVEIEGSAAAWVQPTVQSSPVRGFLQARTLTCSNFQPSDMVETIWVNSSSWHCNTRYTCLGGTCWETREDGEEGGGGGGRKRRWKRGREMEEWEENKKEEDYKGGRGRWEETKRRRKRGEENKEGVRGGRGEKVKDGDEEEKR